jgi:hypothetical protein
METNGAWEYISAFILYFEGIWQTFKGLLFYQNMVMHLEKRSAISNNIKYLGSFEKLHELLNNDHAHYIISINSLIIHL